MRASFVLAISMLCLPARALAGEAPLYQPAPAWVTAADLEAARKAPDAPPFLILDMQQRIENGTLWAYSDSASRLSSPEILAQFATLSLPWMPDKGDLIIHDLTIVREGETIDLLAGGKEFTVIRREQELEQRQLTGILTATMPVEGLQVGDILRMRFSVTTKDNALGGRVQSVTPLIGAPMRIGFGRLRVQWDSKASPRWKVLASDVKASPVRKGAFTELLVPLPTVRQPDMPSDAPMRFRRPPMLEVSTFPSWSDLSRIMAPLYRTEGLIAKDSGLIAELARVKAGATPLDRAQRALQVTQDKVRYLMLGMAGGNYVPRTPEQTWTSRYGDCKAKTLLLLALLRESGIEAEPVLASTDMGDLVPERLPSAAAFDHVLVRAVIDGEVLWLDGTGSGARIEDIRDTPPFRHVLPVRESGADLMPLVMRKDARPAMELVVDADESSSPDLPAVFTAKAALRGPTAAQMALVYEQLDARQRREMVGQFFTRLMGESQYSDLSLSTDTLAGTTTLTGTGVTGTPWKWDDRRMRRKVARVLSDFDFSPDRAKVNWTNIPVATPEPGAFSYTLRLKLPRQGRGYTVEGEQNSTQHVAGREITRSMSLENGIVSMTERIDTTGAEIAAADIPAERDQVTRAQVRAPVIVAPADAPRRWELAGRDSTGATQLAAINAVYDKAIAASQPDDPSVYLGRFSLRRGTGDFAGALADLNRAIAIAPSAMTYLQRANVLRDLGRTKEALADARKARELDPSMSAANAALADMLAEGNELPKAIELLDQRIALGGEARDEYRQVKASTLGTYGNPAEALELVDALIENRPGNPDLLNMRCWIKATRAVMIDSALKDCTSSIELSNYTYAALDSRAVVWYRMGRYEEALQDLNAVLSMAPGLGESRFMRGVVLNRLKREQDAAADLAIARKLEPRIDSIYARFGIAP